MGGRRPDEVGGVVGQATVEVPGLAENYVDYFGEVGGCAWRNEEDQLEECKHYLEQDGGLHVLAFALL